MNRLRQREIIRTTLGDLIAAVTDEVTATFGDSPATYVVVYYIVSDLLIRHRFPAQRCSMRAVV
jgi:hypothetical protein